MTNLSTIDFGSNKWCGPAVMSSVLGISTTESEAALKRATGRVKIVGVTAKELAAAFKLYDRKLTYLREYEPNIESIETLMSRISNPGYYIIMVEYNAKLHHWIVIEINADGKRYLCDNHTKSPLTLGNSSRLGMKVYSCYFVERIEK